MFVKEYGVLFGLLLQSENEAKLFPHQLVYPSAGTGFNENHSGPEQIVSYQLNANECPHLTRENICEIYEKRPLVCRTFPLISLGRIGVTIASPEQCLFVENTEKIRGNLNNILPLTPKKFEASSEWNNACHSEPANALIQAKENGKAVWKFDLGSKRWHRLP